MQTAASASSSWLYLGRAPSRSPLSCTVTVADTDSAPKSAPLGMVSFVVSTSPSGSSSAVGSEERRVGEGGRSRGWPDHLKKKTLGSDTITATYNPAPTSVHATSNGSDTVIVTKHTTAYALS